MSSINKVILIGRLGQDPQIKNLPNGNVVANISLATDESYKDKSGVKQERTEWHRVVMFNRLAEISGQYLRKGSLVYIEGKIQTRQWKNEQDETRYATEILANTMKMLGAKQDAAEQNQWQPNQWQQSATESKTEVINQPPIPRNHSFDDDIPF